MTTASTTFYETGEITDQIDVEISFQIIGLFSEGLYSSPNKAIEELVSNAFDADATCVHVVLSPDRAASGSSVAVIDNGTGMDADGLKVHWIVGDSPKSTNRQTSRGRRTIGKFGIGKLAAYVLGDRLTHITKAGGKYYSTTMDFRNVPKTVEVTDVGTRDSRSHRGPVHLALRTLTASEAKAALAPWLTDATGRADLRLFGRGSVPSWTVAVITDLKPMAVDLSAGMLRWVLSTAMPLRDDFALYLNGKGVEASKLTVKRVGRWTLGQDITSVPKPAPTELEVDVDASVSPAEYSHWLLVDKQLGPVSGYVEVFEDPIDMGKSALVVGRSNGFFVYVHGRLINPEDAGFGIDRNSLRHGTFSRFRVVVNIDRLDAELRSSRERLRDGPALIRARELLQGLFNFARSQLETHESSSTTERKASQRLSESPASLSERPILRMLLDAYDGTFTPRHLLAIDRTLFEDRASLQTFVEARIEEGRGLVADIVYADLGTHLPIAVLDGPTGQLSINLEHPFVAHFADEFGDARRNLPLQLFAISEILLEAELHGAGVDTEALNVVLDSRDELLRHLARSSGAQNSLTVAQNLVNAASSSKELEAAVVVAFRQLGFEAVPKAGKKEPDGLAEAFLPAGHDGVRHYRVSLEAKSKISPGAKVTKDAVGVATIARHRRDANCDYAIVIGPDFVTGDQDLGAVMEEIADDRQKNPGKTITLMRIADLARLVRIAPVKRTNLEQLRDLFVAAQSPDDAQQWVERLAGAEVVAPPYQAILEMIWKLQEDDKNHPIDYGSLRTALRITKKITIVDADLRLECQALSRMAPSMFFARDDRVELNIRPDKVLETIQHYIGRLPEEEKEA